MAKVEILMATYNGESYISEQIESIIKQSYKDWVLIIHDDGSSDSTLEIVSNFSKRDDRITVISDGEVFRSASKNFEHLAKLSSARYVCFSDQDDVWREDHVLNLVEEIESRDVDGRPHLVFSDCTVVDRELNEMHASLIKFRRTSPGLSRSLKMMSVRNCVTGCAMILNRAAIEVSIPFHSKANMHDHWISLCVLKNGGDVTFLDKITVNYRQHAGNVIGADGPGIYRKLVSKGEIKKSIKRTWSAYEQAKEIGAVKNYVQFLMLKALAKMRY